MRVRLRCANSDCGRRITTSGQTRDPGVEADRRRRFYRILAALAPMVGIPRARDAAIAATDVSVPSASRYVSAGVIGPEVRRSRGSTEYYEMVEQAMCAYSLSQRKQTSFPEHASSEGLPELARISPDLVWLLLSRARGLAALVLGLPRPRFGAPAPAAFPSWVDRGARGVDPQRDFFPMSRHTCARATVDRLSRTLRDETPDGYWDSASAEHWLRANLTHPMTLLSPNQRRWLRRHWYLPEEWLGPELELLEHDAPPVLDPVPALRVLRRELRHADGLEAHATEEEVDEGLRYWIDTRPVGVALRVLVTSGGRVVGRAACRLEEPEWTAGSATELRFVTENREEGSTTFDLAAAKVILPWRVMEGANDELAKRVVPLSPPGQRQR